MRCVWREENDFLRAQKWFLLIPRLSRFNHEIRISAQEIMASCSLSKNFQQHHLLPLSRWCDTPKIILKTPLPRRHKDKDKKKYHKRHYIASRWSPCWSSTAAGGIIRKSVVLRFFWHPTFVHTTRVGRESAISPSSNWGEIGGIRGGEWHWPL